MLDINNLVDTSRVIITEQIDVSSLPKKHFYFLIKRIFDVSASFCALIILFVPMVLIAFAIKVESKGPIFYTQERLGKNGKPFNLIKFRSMKIDAERNGAQWATKHDPRVTKVGSFIRGCRLDEIPQFCNVIMGDLSIVGPRPERGIFYNEFEKYIHGFKQRLIVTPGLTGLAQVNGGYNLKPAEKIIYDLEYIKTQSIILDLKIMLKTVIIVLMGRNGGGR